MRAGSRRPSRGFTLVTVLVLLALCMLGLSIAGPMWSQRVRREREHDLLRVGTLYAQAIAAYYAASPGSLKQYPQRLDMLLADSRFVGTRRYLRQLYPDPVNPGQPWGLLLDPQQRIVGVYSRSEATPIAERPLDLGSVQLAAAQRYSDWKFVTKVTP
jgi:type II secretory pathway pseudopilin PulG